MTQDEAVRAEALVETFGRTRALDGLDLGVRAGEVHGFLGPNGSGKTTTIRILLGLMRSDSGAATLLGGDPFKDAIALHRRLGPARSSRVAPSVAAIRRSASRTPLLVTSGQYRTGRRCVDHR